MIVWCTMTVLTLFGPNNPVLVETAVRGKVIKNQQCNYLADFSEYAKKQEYLGSFERKVVSKDDCVKE